MNEFMTNLFVNNKVLQFLKVNRFIVTVCFQPKVLGESGRQSPCRPESVVLADSSSQFVFRPKSSEDLAGNNIFKLDVGFLQSCLLLPVN